MNKFVLNRIVLSDRLLEMVCAWYMDNDESIDQRECHHLDPPKFVHLEVLRKLGVLYWKFDPDTYETDEQYEKLKSSRGYSFQDLIEVCPQKLDNYEAKIKSFYDEHIHKDEEIRFVLDGTGYFDVRDPQDKWIRIEVSTGDMIVLPAGIYHRFTLDTKNYIKALRLFVGEPVWTPYSRSSVDELHPSRIGYKQNILASQSS